MSSTATLLIIEDEGVLALDLERSLRALGFRVAGVAASADEALALAERDTPDLALVDIRIQGSRDGIETAEQLRDRFDVPVVFLSAHSDARTLERANAVRPLGYLLKPFKKPDLQNVISIAVARHLQEQALRAREQLVSATLQAVGDAIVTFDGEGRVSSLNPRAVALIGLPSVSALGRRFGELLTLTEEQTGAPVADPVEAALSARAQVELPIAVLETRAGQRRLVVGTACPATLQGAAPAVVLALRDLTELLTLRKELEFADRLMSVGTLAAGVAHEVLNPLAYVKSNLAFVQGELGAGAVEGQALAMVLSALADTREGVERIEQIVADLKVLVGPQSDEVRPVDPLNAIRFAAAVTRGEWKPRATLALELEPTPLVLADETRLGQVLINLLINAAHAMAGTPAATNRLTVRARAGARGEAVLEVQDTGPGMSPEVRRRIFEPFFTTKGAGVGTGLGLSTSRAIVGRLGGRIEVESEPGAGATFRVVLPGLARA